MYVDVHVDDMAAFTSGQEILDEVFLADMTSVFRIKDDDELQRFLGMDITRSGDSVMIFQERYIEQMLLKFSVTRSAHSPITLRSR